MTAKSKTALAADNRELRALIREFVALNPYRDEDRLAELQKRAEELLAAQDARSRNAPQIMAAARAKGMAAIRANALERRKDLVPIVTELWQQGHTLRAIAAEMMRRGIKTPKGKDNWEAGTVRNLLPTNATRTRKSPTNSLSPLSSRRL